MYNHRASMRAIARHLILRAGLENVRLRLHKLRGNKKIGHLHISNLPDVFTAIYKSDAWIEHEGQESLSGPGSSQAATQKIMGELSLLLQSLDCKLLVDIGCGDFNWMQFVDGDWDYIGIDVVNHIIDKNIAIYGSDRRNFINVDATMETIPPGDVILCREVLFHLSFYDICNLIANIKRTEATYFITTTDEGIWFNSDILSGDFRQLNLSMSPFRFQKYLKRIDDNNRLPSQYLGVWKIKEIPEPRPWFAVR